MRGERVAMRPDYMDQGSVRGQDSVSKLFFIFLAWSGGEGDLFFCVAAARAVGCWLWMPCEVGRGLHRPPLLSGSHARSARGRDSAVTAMGGSIIGDVEPVPSLLLGISS